MSSRRTFLTGLAAATLCPAPSWSDIGAPAYVSAARDADGAYVLCGLSDQGDITFKLDLPARGHAAAPHPHLPYVVGFARRPGRFAYVVDCRNGQTVARLDSPQGRHFYGHGFFSPDGDRLYTTENHYENGTGVIGVWDPQDDYRRVDEFPSGGVGPHDIKRFGAGLVVANGGIETHPDTGRAKLNIPIMQPNLAYLTFEGQVLEIMTLPRAQHKNSIRHLACSSDTVAFAMQWEGDQSETPPLLGIHSPGTSPKLIAPESKDAREMQNYAGSIAISNDGQNVAITSPRGGICQIFNIKGNTLKLKHRLADVCGIAPYGASFIVTTGEGRVVGLSTTQEIFRRSHNLNWDNHLISTCV